MPGQDSSRDYDLLDRLVEEFNDRFRRGERPSVHEYCEKYPALADDLRDVLPAVAQVEGAKDARADDLPAPPPPPPVAQMGDFHILREVGHGGMGVVYEAEQVSLGRRVALKVLTQRLLRDAKQRRRFEREARAAAKLHHTNIVPVHGYGEHDGTPYYVMQFIHGMGLDVVVEEPARMAPTAAHRLCSPAASNSHRRPCWPHPGQKTPRNPETRVAHTGRPV
ncbi:MAG: protein kinase [Gemmataceae bacterium]|nr:protein kinase [Gemmataceae bacterium]